MTFKKTFIYVYIYVHIFLHTYTRRNAYICVTKGNIWKDTAFLIHVTMCVELKARKANY